MVRPHLYTGFSLIELMIVVGLVGILATIAIPSYQDYGTRARLTEAVQLLGAARVNVAEHYIVRGYLPKDDGEAGLAALVKPDNPAVTASAPTEKRGSVVRSLHYLRKSDSQAVISVEISDVGTEAHEKFFSMEGAVSNGKVSWSCRPGDTRGSESNPVPKRLLPANCR